MASKKTLMVNFVRSGRRRWSLSVEGTDPDLLDELTAAIWNAKTRGIVVVNAANPFGEVEIAEKKNRKPRSDKGTIKGHAVRGDGQQVGAGAT